MSWLIVCCDGTWNTPEMASVTNVRRLHNLLDRTPTQETFYASGVGTTGGVPDRLQAGITGADLDAKILDAYRWLVTHYDPEDQIALFGFSRGAYTVRSLSGMISHCGLIEPEGLDAAALEERIRHVYAAGYRERRTGWREDIEFRHDPADHTPVHFIGVWDTVGALGIPGNLTYVSPSDITKNAFHDLELDPHIPAARHALALDEMRGPFTPAKWTTPSTRGQDVEQVWFAGSHTDVGGGHPERGLADITLEWMLGEVRELTTIAFTDPKGQIAPDPLGVAHDDDHNQLGPGPSLLLDAPVDRLTQMFWDSRPRTIPPIDVTAPLSTVHASVYERAQGRPITSGPYRPTRVLARAGDTATVDVAADQPWNDAGLYLQAGTYELTATGTWRDHERWIGAEGTDRTAPTLLTRLGSAAGQVVRMAASVRSWGEQQHPEWVFPGERRQLDLPWMSLVGIVANGGRPCPAEHQILDIGDSASRVLVTETGYLYAYANDAWGSYGDNAGAVRLTVKKTS